VRKLLASGNTTSFHLLLCRYQRALLQVKNSDPAAHLAALPSGAMHYRRLLSIPCLLAMQPP
jgi:hypothetical protein